MRAVSWSISLIGLLLLRCDTLHKAVAQRDSLVEHEAFAGPAAFCFGNGFEIFQDASLEVINLLEATRQHEGTGFLAPNAAGAEHRHLLVRRRIELVGDEVPELAEPFDCRIDGSLESPDLNREPIAGVDDDETGGVEQRVPVARLHISAHLPGRIG